jgi:hypothetical protein
LVRNAAFRVRNSHRRCEAANERIEHATDLGNILEVSVCRSEKSLVGSDHELGFHLR